MDIRITNSYNNDYHLFDILDIKIKPFDNIKDKETNNVLSSSGFYITIEFTVNKLCNNYLRFKKHTNPDYDGFYLDYNESTQVYTFEEAVTSTPTTQGALEELQQLKDKTPNPNYNFMGSTYLYNCIKTLDSFWD